MADKIALLIITDGRKYCLTQTVDSIFQNTDIIFDQIVMINDCQKKQFRDFIDIKYPEFEIIHNDPKRGFGGAIQVGWAAINPEMDFVFHLEEDFVCNRHVPIRDMAEVLKENPHLVQLVLKRQPCYTHEHEAGGLVELYPDSYEEVSSEHGYWTEHRRFYSTNPSLVRQSLVAQGWPDVPISELRFTERMLDDPDNRFAFWGKKFENPWVDHIGIHRSPDGTGY